MIDEADAGQIKFLIKKKKAGLITPDEIDKLVVILSRVSKDKDLPVGLRTTVGIVLANAIGRQKPKELKA